MSDLNDLYVLVGENVSDAMDQLKAFVTENGLMLNIVGPNSFNRDVDPKRLNVVIDDDGCITGFGIG